MEWSDESALELIRLYQDQPILWDPKHGEFKMARKKQDCWTDIAREFRTDVTTVKKKIESLLTSFRRERQREGSASGETGNEQQTVYRSKWYAFKSMQFLNGKFRSKKISNTASLFSEFQPETTEDDGDQSTTTSRQTDRSPRSCASANSTSNRPAAETNASATAAATGGVAVVPQKRKTYFVPPRKRKRRRAAAAEEDPRVEEAFRIFKNLAENRQADRDECAAFGEYVATQLKKFDARTRAIVKHRVQNALFDAEMGKTVPENYVRSPSPQPPPPPPSRHDDSTAYETLQQDFYHASTTTSLLVQHPPLQYSHHQMAALPSFASATAAEFQNRDDTKLTVLGNMNHFQQ